MQLVALVHAIAERKAFGAAPLGLDMTDHDDPSQRSTRVRASYDGLASAKPTAKHRVDTGHVTAANNRGTGETAATAEA